MGIALIVFIIDRASMKIIYPLYNKLFNIYTIYKYVPSMHHQFYWSIPFLENSSMLWHVNRERNPNSSLKIVQKRKRRSRTMHRNGSFSVHERRQRKKESTVVDELKGTVSYKHKAHTNIKQRIYLVGK